MAIEGSKRDVLTSPAKVFPKTNSDKASAPSASNGSTSSPASSGRRSPGPTRSPGASDRVSGHRSQGPRRPVAAQPTGGGGGPVASGVRSSLPGGKAGSANATPTRKAGGGGPSHAPYRYVVLPGNESVLLTEALGRRPWWEPAPGGAGDQRWNLWAGLNGQRFTDFGLLPTLPRGSSSQATKAGGAGAGAGAAATAAAPASSRRLVNRLQEHKVICTKSGLARLLAGIQQVAASTTSTASATASAESLAAGGSAGPASPPSPSPSTGAHAPTGASGGTNSASGPVAGPDTSWIPETYVVPAGPKAATSCGGGGGGGGSLARFQAAYARHAAEGRRVWIAKPTSLNRGNGIEVFDSLDRIVEHIRSRPAGTSLILQKYIERPMLLGGRKFDIRAYVLVGHDGSVWFHREAYCRTSSTPYDSNDLTNRSAHLTNDAVQKHLDSYNAYEDHCKLSLEDLGPALRKAASTASSSSTSSSSSLPAALVRLDTTPGNEAGLWGAMRRCVAALFSAAGPLLNPRRLAHCFELLGLDFMLDEEGGVYLIEVNTSPALFRAGAYLADLLPRLVEEVVQKVVDPLFPPPSLQQQGQQTPPHKPAPPTTAQQSRGPQTETETEAAAVADAGAASEGTAEAGIGVVSCSTGVGGGASGVKGAGVPPGLGALDGFVRVALDEQFGAAAAAAAAGSGPRGPVAAGRAAAILLKSAALGVGRVR